MNKCILKKAWKDIKTLLIIATAVVVFIAVLFFITAGIGYVSAYWFNLCLEVVGNSPIEYYSNNGTLLLLLTVFILLIVALPFLILYTIYNWIKDLKHRCR